MCLVNLLRKDFVMEILRVENLTKRYGKGDNQVVAVDDVSFSIEKASLLQ